MRVKEAMEAHNQTWATLSSSTGKTSSSFIQVANGNPTVSKLKETAAAIGCHWLEFFTDEISKEEAARIFGLIVPPQEAVSQPAAEPAPKTEASQADNLPFTNNEPEQQAEKREAVAAIICPHCGEAIKLAVI